MKTKSPLLAFSAIAILTSAPFPTSAFGAATTPSRVDSGWLTSFPYNTSGIIWNGTWRGSGTVAVNPKVAVSCAHITFNNGSWLTGNNWAPAYHSSTHPANSTAGHAFRNYWMWTNYTGGTSNTAYYYDFAVHYSYANLAGGAYSGWVWNNSTTAHPLNSSSTYKLIVGYPSSDSFFMNSTGYFTSAYSSRYWQNFWNPSVKGGNGMSGGGVFTWTDSQWKLAGVHVAGNTDGSLGAGARALDQNAQNLIDTAIYSTNTPPAATVRSFSNYSAAYIPDNYAGWTSRDVGAYYMPATLTAATISYNISHTWIGDLEVMLTAPNGRSLTLHNRAGGSADNIVVYGQDISGSFAGLNPNGNWRLSVRDLAGADVGYLNNVSLTLTAR